MGSPCFHHHQISLARAAPCLLASTWPAEYRIFESVWQWDIPWYNPKVGYFNRKKPWWYRGISHEKKTWMRYKPWISSLYPMVYPIPWMINLHKPWDSVVFPPIIQQFSDAMAGMAPTSSCQCRSSAERSWSHVVWVNFLKKNCRNR